MGFASHSLLPHRVATVWSDTASGGISTFISSILRIELVGDGFIVARCPSPPYEYIKGGDFCVVVKQAREAWGETITQQNLTYRSL